ncbi:MAG: efflux RND transporter permease subunit, partial [Clostridia bacterium]|nr:efflux RND transporter permease subunit [Clostridia bacterium]
MKLHELSVKRPIAVTMAVLIFVVIGVYSLSMLPIDAMPEMDLKMAVVMTTYQNVGSEEIENLITEPIEEAIASVSGLDTMQSQSMEGMSVVMVQFTNTTDIDEAVSTIENNIDMISMMLPEDASEPTVLKLDMNSMASMMMSVSYEGYDLIQTKQFIEDNVEHKLKSAGGVASVNISGGRDRLIEIEVDPDKMQGYNMSFTDIVGAISGQNNNLPAGNTEFSKKDLSVRMMGEFEKLSEIGLVPLTTAQGQVIYIKDIADVKEAYSDESTYSRINGENSISISISSESDANTVDVVNGVKKALEEIKAEHPKFNYNITMEQASYIEESIASVAESALIGGILAIIILFLFLGNAKNALVIGVSMPVSVITTFIGLFMSGMTLNIVSLGGLALGVGMLVDNAVVVLENIFRRRKTYGDDAKTGAMKGTAEVIGAVVASVLT